MQCNKPTIRMLAKLYEKDLRSVYGNNLRKIATLCNENIEDLLPHVVKRKVKFKQLPENEAWRVPILTEMIFARENNLEVEGLSKRDISDIIHYVCTV